MYTINFWPILVSSILAFGISALWYSPIIFGREWLALSKITDADVKEMQARGIWKLYVVQLIATIVSFAIMAFILVSVQARGGSNGAFIGFLIWLGFVATEALDGLLWEKKSFKLVLIQTVVSLINLVIGGAIIGAWK